MIPTPSVFVLGCPRSGTTFIAEWLNTHPDLRVSFWEAQFPLLLIRRTREPGPPGSEPETALELDQALVWHGIDVPARIGERALDRAAVGRILGAWREGATPAARRDRAAARYWEERGPGAGDKAPDFTFIADDLRDLHPGACRIWIRRNLQENAASMLAVARRKYHVFCPPDPRGAALVWLRREEQRLRCRSRPDRDLTVDYDEFCAHPAERSRDLLRAIGLESAPETEAFVASRFQTPVRRGPSDPSLEEFAARVREEGLPPDIPADLLAVDAQYAADPIPLLDRAVKRDPGCFRALAGLAEAHWRRGDADAVARWAEAACARGAIDPFLNRAAGKAALLRAWAARVGGDTDGAREWTKRSLELFPDYGLARRYLDEVLKSKHRHETHTGS